MRQLLCTLTLLALIQMAFAQAPPWLWANIAGGGGVAPGFEEETTDMVVDDEGNTYLTGFITYFTYFDTLYFNGYGGKDIFLAKYDCDGQLLWAQTAGSNSNNEERSFVALDSAGYPYWAGQVNTTNGTFTFQDSVYSITGYKYFISKIDPNTGDALWFRHGLPDLLYGMTLKNGYIYTNAITFSAGGNIDTNYVVRQYLAKFDLQGQLVDLNNFAPNTNNFVGERIEVDNEGNLFMTGTINNGFFPLLNDTVFKANAFSSDGLVFKFNDQLELLWYQQYPGANFFQDLTIDGNGNVYVAVFNGDTINYGTGFYDNDGTSSRGVIFKMDNSGVGKWVKGTSYNTLPMSAQTITIDDSANLYMCGYSKGTAAFETDTLTSNSGMSPYFVSYDSAGNYRYWRDMDCLGTQRNVGYNIATDRNGNVYMAGTFGTALLFNGTQINVSGGDTDLFLAKFGQQSCLPPCPLPVAGFGLSANGLRIDLNDSSQAADNVYYLVGNTAVVGSAYTVDSAGTYQVCQIVSNACGDSTLCRSITVLDTVSGIRELVDMVNIYPNPTQGLLHVQVYGHADLQLFDLQGKLVHQVSLEQNNNIVDLGHLQQGMYLYRIALSNGQVVNGKVLVE